MNQKENNTSQQSTKEIIFNFKKINAFQLLFLAIILIFVNFFLAFNVMTQIGQDLLMVSGTVALIVESFMKQYPKDYKQGTWLLLIIAFILNGIF